MGKTNKNKKTKDVSNEKTKNDLVKEVAFQYNIDKKNVEDFLSGQSQSINFYSLKRLIATDIAFSERSNFGRRYCGFSRQKLESIAAHPERFGREIVRLSQYFCQRSGYYKRILRYLSNMPMINWTVDIEAKNYQFNNVKASIIEKNYLKFIGDVNKYKLDLSVNDIFYRMMVCDAVFGFVYETEVDTSIFFLEPEYCEIKKINNGNVFQFAVNKTLLNSSIYETLPKALIDIIEQSNYDTQIEDSNMVLIPIENCLCFKYNNDYPYLYPPFFDLIKSILLIEDYTDLAKAKTEADAYKLVYLKIPTEDGKVTMGNDFIYPFTDLVKSVVPEQWGVVPVPMDLELVESSSTATDDTNKVQEATTAMYEEAGISESIFSSANNGATLKISMKVDSSDIYRIYRMIEAWMTLQMKLKGHVYTCYEFVYNILDMTIFDEQDVIDRELKLAQASLVNKFKLHSAMGVNPAKLIGNARLENEIFAGLFSNLTPLKTSYTMSGSGTDNTGGATQKEDTELTEKGQQSRDSGANDSDNRV